jgi:hypothetical protein
VNEGTSQAGSQPRTPSAKNIFSPSRHARSAAYLGFAAGFSLQPEARAGTPENSGNEAPARDARQNKAQAHICAEHVRLERRRHRRPNRTARRMFPQAAQQRHETARPHAFHRAPDVASAARQRPKERGASSRVMLA